MESYISTNHKRYIKSQEKAGKHWMRDAVYDFDSETDGEPDRRPQDRGTAAFLKDLREFVKDWNLDPLQWIRIVQSCVCKSWVSFVSSASSLAC